MRNEWKELAEKLLFDFGKVVLGKKSGGLIVKLLHERGIDGARNVIKAASEKENAREYITGAMRENGEGKVQIGDELGGYVWNGSRWAERDIEL